MIIDTNLGMNFHQHRMEQLRETTPQQRLKTRPTRQSRSFSLKLGIYRLNLIKEPKPRLPNLA